MIKNITSLDNKIIKELVKIRDDSKFRHENKICFLEGERLIFDTDINLIENIFISADYKNLLDDYVDKNIYILDNKVFNKIKSTSSSQGIIATAKFNNIENISDISTNRFILILDDIRDPGNLGTIIRTAEASGVETIIISHTSCDIYMDKVIRSSMSSIFRVNHYISKNLIDDINYLKNAKFDIIGTKADSDLDYYNINIDNKKIAIVIGNEANGISGNVLNLCNYNIKIDMDGKIESLNAAIATSVICFEMRKKIKNEKICNS